MDLRGTANPRRRIDDVFRYLGFYRRNPSVEYVSALAGELPGESRRIGIVIQAPEFHIGEVAVQAVLIGHGKLLFKVYAQHQTVVFFYFSLALSARGHGVEHVSRHAGIRFFIVRRDLYR